MSEQDEDNQAPENNTADYEVGYKRPPKHSQFKKGQSGFAGRRRKDTRKFETILTDELAKPITVVENGRRKKITMREAMAKRLINAIMNHAKPREILRFLSALPQEVLDQPNQEVRASETTRIYIERMAEFGRDRERFRALKEEVGVDPYLLIEAMCQRLGIAKGNLTSLSENLVSAYLATIKTEKT